MQMGQQSWVRLYINVYISIKHILTQMTNKAGSGLFPLTHTHTLLHDMNIQHPLLRATFKAVLF